jgi:hypothetical protein
MYQLRYLASESQLIHRSAWKEKFSESHIILIPFLSSSHPIHTIARNTELKFLVTRITCKELMVTKTS